MQIPPLDIFRRWDYDTISLVADRDMGFDTSSKVPFTVYSVEVATPITLLGLKRIVRTGTSPITVFDS